MKRKIFIIVVTVLTLIGLSAGLVACGNTNITRAQAKEVVLQNIGANESQLTYVTVDSEEINGEEYFEIEAVLQGVKYSYLLNAKNGEIVKQSINGQNVNPETAPSTPIAKPENYITRENALLIALENAGTVETAVTEIEVEYDYAFGNYLYEIEFKLNGVEYEYEINAVDGSIFEKSVEGKTEIIPTSETYITSTRATEIALENANLTEAEITLKKAQWELDNGVAVYEVEFIANGHEYEYTIQAITGAILEIESDLPEIVTPSTSTIAKEEALQKALAHAGLEASQVTATKVELDVDHGVTVYEVEFNTNEYEYEYEINAETGKVIKAEKELID